LHIAYNYNFRLFRLGYKSSVVRTQNDDVLARQALDRCAQELMDTLNTWGNSTEFEDIKAAIGSLSERLRVTISTECAHLRRLPFHEWNLFPAGIEAVFSSIDAKKLPRPYREKIRILVILGGSAGINVEEDKKLIEEYCQDDAMLSFLKLPTREKLSTTLADAQGWDIIFFSGHSHTEEGNSGHIDINDQDSLTMDELEDILAPAIEQRVQIAIFNSCDGLGIAPVLEKLNIDRIVVMREPIPDLVAQKFLKSFLRAFTKGDHVDDAVGVARQELVEFEKEYPYVRWLPVTIQNRLVDSPTWQSLGKIRSPYKGLEAFTEADAANFYGREETIELVTNLVSQEPLVSIVGASGSGKSSLVQAGLIPKLRQDSHCQWQILTMRPGQKPFDALAQAIALTNRTSQEMITLNIELESNPQALTQKLAQIRNPQHRMLLFIDQFEELFTQVAEPTICQKFLKSLADAVRYAPNFTLVFTLRDDFLPKLQNNVNDDDFRPLLERYRPQPLVGMTRDRLRAAINEPVKKRNVEFEDGLVDRLVQDVGNDAGNLPLLQLVLNLLWQEQEPRKLTHQAYDRICGNKGLTIVLAKLADQIYDGYVKQGRVEQFKQVLLCLVMVGDGQTPNTRRIATYADIGEKNWQEIVVPLSKARLLKTTCDEKTQAGTVEIIHETLIQSWQLLTDWIEDYRHDLERIADIEEAAIKWDSQNRSKEELWTGKDLKAAQTFLNDMYRFLSLKPIAYDFLAASCGQQSWNRRKWWISGIILSGITLASVGRDFLIHSHVQTIKSSNTQECTNDITRAIEGLKFVSYEFNKLDLSNRNLNCAKLSDVYLSGAKLSGAYLRGADLSDAYLSDADLSDANLRGANLSDAYREHVKFSERIIH
jgi:energy-coupling factor transporter ATP-binding protein EcfA2